MTYALHNRNSLTREYGLTKSVAPTTNPVTDAEAKIHLRVDHTDEDALIGVLVTAATNYCEVYTNRQFMTATFVMTMDAFPGVFYMPRPKLLTVTSIVYVDTAGDSQTLAASTYTTDITRVKGRIVLAYGKSWPVTQAVINAVTVTYTAGYGAASAVPDQVKAAILMYVADMYEHRSVGTEFTTGSRGVGEVKPNPTANAMLDAVRVVEAT